MTNEDIATLLRNVAAAYQIHDEKKHIFQIVAYQKAKDTIAGLATEIGDLLKSDEKIPGVGPSIHAHLDELIKTGHVKHFDEVLARVPDSVFPLLDVTSIGPKKAYKLVTALALNDRKTVVDDLLKAALEDKISTLPTFGKKSQEDIIVALTEFKQGKVKSNRMPLPYAFELAKKIESYLKSHKNAKKVSPLGSLRRMRETIGDLDFAVASDDPESIIEHFIKYPSLERVIEKGPMSSSILVSGGKQIDLMVIDESSFGALLQHFTGSKYHNVALRDYALKKGYSLSEKGIKLKKENDRMKKFATEENFYKFLGLAWPAPEIRENKGEIELAIANKLPELVELRDIKGDLHIHSNYPIEPSHDLGHDSMQDMIDKAIKLKYEYIGFSEHNPSYMNHTKDEIYKILEKRMEKIEQLRKSNKNIRIHNLLELDILPSGALALDEKGLQYVDAVLVSIHSVFKTPKAAMTKRILNGLSHPKAKILTHPSGRLINERAGYEVDYDALFAYALENNKAIEINSWPTRLDLTDSLVFEARKLGVKFVINTDSHALAHMDSMFYGVSVARRGWCTKEDILNTYSAEKFEEFINSK